jgi:hypothetical protein
MKTEIWKTNHKFRTWNNLQMVKQCPWVLKLEKSKNEFVFLILEHVFSKCNLYIFEFLFSFDGHILLIQIHCYIQRRAWPFRPILPLLLLNLMSAELASEQFVLSVYGDFVNEISNENQFRFYKQNVSRTAQTLGSGLQVPLEAWCMFAFFCAVLCCRV